VITENERTLAAAEALVADDRDALGALFAASHASLRDDFAVSTPALDTLVEIARTVDGVVGSRMTGAGFGGCTVNLVVAEGADAALAEISKRYETAAGRPARGWISRPASGATVWATDTAR
jgi:galactokinase